jgi:anaerobic selenocysteine-containing dehydrogenase
MMDSIETYNHMSTTITRRDILKFTGGSIIGMMFSPLPWKLLDDSAIWTQTWGLTPKLAHGPITSVFTHCTMCPAGCALKAQCVSGMPFALTGVPSHPYTHGTTCTRGLAGHHMANHPLRIIHPHTFSSHDPSATLSAVSLQDAIGSLTHRIAATTGTIAILDRQPGRAISEQYRAFLEGSGRGVYLNSPSGEESMLSLLQTMVPDIKGPLGFDLENTEMVVSFGAPVLDGWGTPGRMTELRNAHKASIVQIDSRYSRSAMQADRWLAIAPGTERIAALSIASVLLEEHLVPNQVLQTISDLRSFRTMAAQYLPETAAPITGIEADRLRSLAHDLANARTAIVLSGADPGGGPLDIETERTIAALNILIGTVGKTGGIISRNEIPGYRQQTHAVRWEDVADHSIETLIVDGADAGYGIPWSLIERKLTKNNSMIVSLSSVLDQFSAHADLLLPSPAHLESLQDVPTNCGYSNATFAISLPIMPKKNESIEPIEVLRMLAEGLKWKSDIPTQEAMLKEKVSSIHAQRRGTVINYSDGSMTAVRDIASSEDLWTLLTAGALWVDDPVRQIAPRSSTLGLSENAPTLPDGSGLQLLATGWRGAVTSSMMSPIMSKVFQETELRPGHGTVSLNPVTAEALSLRHGMTATISTQNGSETVTVMISPMVRPGIAEGAIGPMRNGLETPAEHSGQTLLHLCVVADDGTWRITPAQFLKA